MLLFRVVSTPGGQKKVNVCLYLSLLYLVPVVNTPAPLGSPSHTPPISRFARSTLASLSPT